MVMTYVIGIDSSTTASKAVVWDRDGNSLAEGRAGFDLNQPQPGFHEQDAEDWWRSTMTAIRDAVRQVDASAVEAIGLTHQRETFVCLDEHDEPLRPAILWMDARAGEQVAEYGASGTVLRRDGNRGPVAAPQGVYPCAGDDRWLALAVEDVFKLPNADRSGIVPRVVHP